MNKCSADQLGMIFNMATVVFDSRAMLVRALQFSKRRLTAIGYPVDLKSNSSGCRENGNIASGLGVIRPNLTSAPTYFNNMAPPQQASCPQLSVFRFTCLHCFLERFLHFDFPVDQGFTKPDRLHSRGCVEMHFNDRPSSVSGTAARYENRILEMGIDCRIVNGWSAPPFITLSGGSLGLQIGVKAVDLVMIIQNEKGYAKAAFE